MTDFINKVFNEDCILTMQNMPDNFIDLTVTSPPYDGLRKYNGYSFHFEKIATELFRITKEGGVLVWVVGDSVINGSESLTSFKQALFFQNIGFNVHDTMIYYKTGLTMNHNRYEQEFEYMFVFSKGKPKTFNPIRIPCEYYGKDGDRQGQFYGKHGAEHKKLRSEKARSTVKNDKIKGNIWKYNTGNQHSTKDKFAFEHPAIFPEKLAADHIKSWSNEGDLVYDCFGGSGTVPKMSYLLKRNYVVSELSENYCKIIYKRLGAVKNAPKFDF